MTGKPRQPRGMRRSIANDRRLRSSATSEAEAVFDPIVPFSKKPNARYGPAAFHAIMMGAAALGASIFGYTAAVRRWKTASCMLAKRHREAPCGEWMSHICLGIDPGDLARSLEGMISSHLDRLQSLGLLRGKRMDIAIDMHLIRRWDRKHGAELVRSKSKGRTGTFERYVVAQCVRPGVQLALALLHMPALEDTADYVRRAITACRGTGAGIGTVMLDREFFSTDVIRTLEELGVGYLVPCVNTPNVVDAITEFSKGERPQVSGFRITKSKNDYAEYAMIITERKRKSKKRRKAESCEEEPEERYIAFATNRPGIDVDRYAERWMIETGFRMVENERVRTRSRSVTVRTLCFLYSLVLFNAWVLANAELTSSPLALGGVYSRFTQTDMKVIMLMEILPWSMDGGKPPPDPHCPCCTGATCRGISAAPPLPRQSLRGRLPQ